MVTTVRPIHGQSTVHCTVVLDRNIPVVGKRVADIAEPVADTAKLAALPNTVVSRVESTAEAAGVANIGRIAAEVRSSHMAAGFGQKQKAAEQEMAGIAPAWRIVGQCSNMIAAAVDGPDCVVDAAQWHVGPSVRSGLV